MATKLSFAFVLVKDPPSRKDLNDTIWKFAVPYMRFRHPDVNFRHWVFSVKDAQLIILGVLKATKDSELGAVHLYSHSNPLGSVWGRLTARKERYRALTPAEMRTHLNSSKLTQMLAKQSKPTTVVYVHGCNLGKSIEAMKAWRDLLGGSRGFVCAPTLFQHYCAGPLTYRPVCPNGSPFSTTQKFYSLRGLDRLIEDALDDVPTKCRGEKEKEKKWQRKDVRDAVRKKVYQSLDDKLWEKFKKLRDGNQLPWKNAASLNKKTAAPKMRQLFDSNSGLPITFLADTHFTIPSLGRECDEEKLKREAAKQGKRVFFPWDTPQWDQHHRWEPRKPNPPIPW